MMFIALLMLVTLSIAGSAAFFSVYGMAQVFSGAFMPVVIMMSSLEAGKLIAASFAYRYWGHIGKSLKIYLLTAIFVLMVVTSAGIYGFLSAAYQKNILPLAEMEEKVVLLEEKATDLEKLRSQELQQRQRLFDDRAREIAALPANYATKKKEVAQRYEAQIARADENIAALALQLRTIADEKSELKLTKITQETKVGPIVFIAEAFDRDANNATSWLILIIIFAFDPLAVALTIGANIALVERQTHKRRRKDDRVEMIEEALDIDEPEPSVTTIDQIFSEPTENITPDQIREAIEEINQQEQTNPATLAQKGLLEEMLRRKTITEKIRNPNKES